MDSPSQPGRGWRGGGVGRGGEGREGRGGERREGRGGEDTNPFLITH